jgi:hypothetical protein
MSSGAGPRLLLKEKMETYLAALAAYYKKANEDVLLEIVVLSSHRVEHWSHDNWDGGIDGAALYLEVPESTFHKIVGQVEEAARRIANDLGQFVNIHGEFVERVFLEPRLGQNANWRAAFGSIGERPAELPDMQATDAGRLGRQALLRVFISHKADHKKLAAQIKADLDELGAACFVAYEDVQPTREWQLEIEKALFSMECFVALLTAGFHESLWTDQEIGVAVGRRIPVVPVRFGCDPYGFIGKYQAVLVPHDATDSEVSLKIASAILLLPVVSGRFVEG